MFFTTTTIRHHRADKHKDKEARWDVGLHKKQKQMKLMVKSDLQLHQRMRLMVMESAVLVAQTIKTDNGIPIALKTDGAIYHSLTVGQSGHSFGPPEPYFILRAAIAAHTILTNLRNPPSEEGRQNALHHIKTFVEGCCTPALVQANDPRIERTPAKDNIGEGQHQLRGRNA